MRNTWFLIPKQYSRMIAIIAGIFLLIFLYYEKCYISYSYYYEQKMSSAGYIIYFLSEGLVQVLYIPIPLIVIASQVIKDYYSNPSFAVRLKSRYKLSQNYIGKALTISVAFVLYINVMLIIISLSIGFDVSVSGEYVSINLLTVCACLLYMLIYYSVYIITSSIGMGVLISGLLYIIQAVIWKGGFYDLKGIAPFYNIVANEYVSSCTKPIYWILVILAVIIVILLSSGNDMGINISPKAILKRLITRNNTAVTVLGMLAVSIFIIYVNYHLFKSIYHNETTLTYIIFRGYGLGNIRDMIMNLLLILPVMAYLFNYMIKRITVLSVYYYMKSKSTLKLIGGTGLVGLLYTTVYYISIYIMCTGFSFIYKGVGEKSIYDELAASINSITISAGYIVITLTLATVATGLYILISRIDIAIIITLIMYLLLSNIAATIDKVSIFIPMAQNNYSITRVIDNSTWAVFIAMVYLILSLFLLYKITVSMQEKILTGTY